MVECTGFHSPGVQLRDMLPVTDGDISQGALSAGRRGEGAVILGQRSCSGGAWRARDRDEPGNQGEIKWAREEAQLTRSTMVWTVMDGEGGRRQNHAGAAAAGGGEDARSAR